MGFVYWVLRILKPLWIVLSETERKKQQLGIPQEFYWSFRFMYIAPSIIDCWSWLQMLQVTWHQSHDKPETQPPQRNLQSRPQENTGFINQFPQPICISGETQKPQNWSHEVEYIYEFWFDKLKLSLQFMLITKSWLQKYELLV